VRVTIVRKPGFWTQAGIQALLFIVGLFILIPVWVLFYLAFDGSIKGIPLHFRIWPEVLTLDIFSQVIQHPSQNESFLGLLKNSLIVSGGAALISVLLGASMAYAFARYRFYGRRIGAFALLLGAMLPFVALMVPLYVLLEAIHIRTTLFGLMLVYTAFAIPFCIWNMRAAFQAAPIELEESAYMDGATDWQAFMHISLPTVLPAIGIAGMIAFLIGYSEFAMGWLFVEKSSNVTLAMAISGLLGNSSASGWNNLAALAIAMSIPVIIIFMVFRNYFIERFTFFSPDK
jgi:arabinogalactan oligomer/maltooligosaccharide transport system permease protein